MKAPRPKRKRASADEAARRPRAANGPENEFRVLVSDASALDRDGLAKILEDQPRLEISGPPEERKAEIAGELPADAVVLDLDLPPGTGTVHVQIDAFPGGRICVVGLDERYQDERCVVRHDDQEHATLRFGDGARGARLPSGTDHVTARYRVGAGRAGNVDPGRVAHGQIKLLYKPPASLGAVINPTAVTGGADPEEPAEVRTSAPRAVSVLDRAVSLADYQSVARALPGVSRASASPARSPQGDRRIVRIVIGGGCDC